MTHNGSTAEQLFAGKGEMAMRMRSHDWSQTSLGAVETWSQSLKTAIRIMLTSNQPMWVWWGEELLNLYNDAYRPILGGKHPAMFARPAAEVWREIWDEVGPRAESTMLNNEGTYDESLLLIMERNGYPEETYYTFSYSPIPDDQGRPGGIICANTDDTQRIIGERQLALLKELAICTTDARTFDEACRLNAECLETNPYDLPFAMIYLVDSEQQRVVLAGTSGIDRTHPAVPETVHFSTESTWSFAEVIQTQKPVLVSDLAARFDNLPTGDWNRVPHQAVVIPIPSAGQTGRSGILVAGLNPLRLFDDNYRSFINLVAGQIAASVANANAYEEERRRAEQLAELDRAKTAFFSNVSHEFRTPLTLMLSPMEELSNTLDDRLQPDEREQLRLVQRNGLRLQKLVNTLLDFSRIEAGRVQASYEPTDLATYTAELASVFRSLIERAEMTLQIDCSTLPEPVYVDREMWEKIVLNLISNAFKFTFTGSITIRLQTVGNFVELSVADTGVGIPEAELPKLFERFHRVEGSRSRTYEGSGIGLALVQELVKLHGGNIRVTSQVDRGTTFAIAIPVGSAHLPQDRIEATRTLTSTALGANPYVAEASRWLSDAAIERAESLDSALSIAVPTRSNQLSMPTARVLLVDDNADMRDYVKRLLSQYWEVETVSDGLEALEVIAQRPPDLVLSDVMMPRLDGFGLLRELRANPTTQNIPVILLSARAGEEARIEGLEAGADDYLTKPFSARELLARVESNLKLAQLRKQAETAIRQGEERLKLALEAGRMVAWEWNPFEDAIISTDLSEIYGIPNIQSAEQGFTLVHPEDQIRHQTTVENAVATGSNYQSEFRFIRPDTGAIAWFEERGKAILNDDGSLQKLIGTTIDITDRKQAESALQQREAELRLITNAVPVLISFIDAEQRYRFNSQKYEEWFGHPVTEMSGKPIRAVLGEAAYETIRPYVEQVLAGEQVTFETQVPYQDGGSRYVEATYVPRFNSLGVVEGFVALVSDITDRKRAELNDQFLNQLDVRLRQLPMAEAMAEETVNSVGEFLNVDHCLWGAIDLDQGLVSVEHDWRQPGVSSLVGTHRISDFILPGLIDLYQAGHPAVASDSTTYPYTAPFSEHLLSLNIYAFLSIPCIHEGRWVAILFVNSTTVRQWRSDEVTLLQEVVARLWSLIEHTRAVQELRQSEAQFRQLADAMPQQVWMTDAQGNTQYLNQQWTTYTGLTIEQTHDIRYVTQVIHPDDFEATSEHWQTALTTGMPYQAEFRLKHQGGDTYRWFLSRAIAIRDEQGQVVRWFGTSTDVEAFKRAQAEREQLLQREQAAREAAENANRIKDEFLAVLSHELRSPLNPILGWSRLLQNGKLDATRTTHALETIERNAQLQVQLIEDLLDISRILRGKLTLTVAPVDLSLVISAALETVRLAAEAKALQIQTILSPTAITVSGDAGRLQQVIWNLLSNAVKFTPTEGHIIVELSSAGTNAQIQVKDTGKGINRDFLPYVFEHFRQEDGATTRKFGGLGLGLAIASQIVELHGGQISVDSPGEGQGATFTVQLPLLGNGKSGVGSRDKVDSPLSTPHSSLAGLQILVVDDETDSREFVAFVLEQAGANVTRVASGIEALQVIEKTVPDLIVSDVGMPEMDGYMLLQQVRSLEQVKHIPAIALTAYAGEFDRQQALNAGFQRHLSKPIDPDALVKAISDLSRGSSHD